MRHVPPMTRKQRVALIVGCAGLGLSGCVAAVIPVAAGSLIGRKKLRHPHQPRAARAQPAARAPGGQSTPAAAAAAASTPTSDVPGSGLPLPLAPADLSTMKIGQTYRGGLPSPTGAIAQAERPPKPAAPATPATTTTPVPTIAANRSVVSTWSDVVHFAASSTLAKPTASVLLAKGSTAAAPRWLPCGDKPVAVMVALPPATTTSFIGSAADYLTAIETMGMTLVFTSDQPDAVVARQRASVKAAGASAPLAGTTLFIAKPGQEAANRATIGSRYCVVAIAGSRAADFPDATLPATPGASPGWFLIR